MSDLLSALLLGILEGLTEFLPISSTGHLLIAQHWLGARSDFFNIVIQAGAIVAVVLVFRQRLLQWRADLVEESKQTIENLREEVRDIGDEAERATRETENSLELRTRDRYRKLIGKIDSTLKRLDNGDYVYCVDTGEEIGLERLEARLTAERTLDAQERWEHLQKQMGD